MLHCRCLTLTKNANTNGAAERKVWSCNARAPGPCYQQVDLGIQLRGTNKALLKGCRPEPTLHPNISLVNTIYFVFSEYILNGNECFGRS